MSEYRPKSERLRLESGEEQRSAQTVVSSPGRVGSQNKGLLSLIFLGDPKEAVESAIRNIVLPSLKDTFLDSVGQVLSTLLNGSDTRGRGYQNRPNYRAYYGDRREPVRANPSTRDEIKFLVYDSRADATRVLSKLREDIAETGVATVGAYYSYSGVHTSSNEFGLWSFGWDNLDDVDVHRMSDGYSISLPNPEPIKDMERRKP